MSEQSFIVIESPEPAAFDQACADLAAAGLPVTRGFEAAGPGQARAGTVPGELAAQQAVLAALAGAHLVIAATAPREVIDMLCDDLRRLGNLDHRVGDQPPRADPALNAGERALLERLLAGDSLGQAAGALHLSRRTADRRLPGSCGQCHFRILIARFPCVAAPYAPPSGA